VRCGSLAIGTGPAGEDDYCVVHMPVDLHRLGVEEFARIADLVGAEEADRLQDLAFPGPVGITVINDREWYSWAKNTRKSLEQRPEGPSSRSDPTGSMGPGHRSASVVPGGSTEAGQHSGRRSAHCAGSSAKNNEEKQWDQQNCV
jgi:hypothetical protein